MTDPGRDARLRELMGPAVDYFNTPDTHPTTPERAAEHEAAHVVVAAMLGIIPVQVSVDGTRGNTVIALPSRFESLKIEGDGDDPLDPNAAVTYGEIRTLGLILMASLALMEHRAVPEKWTACGDVIRASRLAGLRAGADERVWCDEAKVMLQRPDAQAAVDAVAAALLKGPLDAVDIRGLCAAVLPPQGFVR